MGFRVSVFPPPCHPSYGVSDFCPGRFEGVENFDQICYLRQYGIKGAQGHVFAPPLPGSAFLELMKALAPQPSEVLADKAVHNCSA